MFRRCACWAVPGVFTATIGVSIIAMLAPASLASEAPSLGIVHNTVETNALSYNCKMSGAELLCKFTQLSVRHKANPKDEKATIEKARAEYRTKGVGLPKKECQGFLKIDAAIKSGVPPKGVDINKWKNGLGSKAGQKLRDQLVPLIAYCKNPSEVSFLNFIRAGFLADTRTCNVSSNEFEQRFKHFATTNTWVATQEGPVGVCGIVNISKFVPVKLKSITFWNYISKKVITNKEGNIFLGKCSELDEGDYLFEWRSQPKDMRCDVIKFGAF